METMFLKLGFISKEDIVAPMDADIVHIDLKSKEK
jgi:hypothetical protein